MPRFIRLEYRPTPKSGWRKSSLRMYAEGRANMERDAKALALQEGWAETRIVEES